MSDHQTRYEELKEYYAEKVDTPKPPIEVGDTVKVHQLAGIHSEHYPFEGTVKRIEPRGVGTHNIFADWFIRVHFTEEQLHGAVYKGTTELFCVGGSRRSWDELPIEATDD